ncbi:hypothetical protein [Kurthia sp. Dielmo]|uniref:hypothetical protein n=1 Tax=Kurthia sp. Dielmo TaxID=1033738 RepID=UPI00030581DA|nr:hypothetical protein [Kurthia sp. Dielmo]
MEKIYVMFDEYNLNIKEKISISNSSPFKVDYIIEFKISPLELRSSNILDELLSKKSTIFCNDIEIGNKADFQHLCSSRDDFSSFEFRVIKKFFLSEPIHLYTNSGQVEFLNHLLKKKLNTLINLTKKITIITFKNGIVNQKGNKSSIFEFLDKSPENFNAQLIDEKTLNFINKNKESKLVLGTIPNILSEGIFNSLDILPIIKSFLQSLANESNSSKFYFKGKFNLIINVSNYYAKDKMLAHFQSLIKITKYINQSEVTADQKKTFLRKSICEDKVQDANLNLEDMDTAFFEKVYNDTTFLFDTFETGEVAVFLKEKKSF